MRNDCRFAKTLEVPKEGHVGRVIDWFALVATAGHLATYLGLTDWPKDEAFSASLAALGDWLDARQPENAIGDQATVARTRDYLSAHAAEFHKLGVVEEVTDPLGWKGDKLFYIPKSTWALIHDGTDISVAARALERSGLLVRGEGDNLMRKAPREIPGRPRVYAIKVTILDGPSAAESLLELPKAA